MVTSIDILYIFLRFLCGHWLVEAGQGILRGQLLQQLVTLSDVIEDWPAVLSVCCDLAVIRDGEQADAAQFFHVIRKMIIIGYDMYDCMNIILIV